MKLKKNSLKIKVWLYFILFSVCILAFLWIFQVLSLNNYYEYSKKGEIKTVVTKIKNNYNGDLSVLDTLSNNYQVCIEVYENYNNSYISNNYDRGCNGDGQKSLTTVKKQFILSNSDVAGYRYINPRFGNRVYMYGIKLNHEIVFVSSSLQPMNATVTILQGQLIVISILVLVLSLLIAFYLSKKISKPIEEINTQAKRMASGDYNFEYHSSNNIEELNELTKTLTDTNNELAKTENLRKELLANVSHDLKTPLTMIKAYAEMVKDITYKDPKKRDEHLDIIISETDRLNVLVNDLLELSVLEANNNLIFEETEINDFVINVLKQYNIYVENEGYQIEFINCPNTIVKFDKKRMQQVLYNLINNAINYTGNDKKVTIKLIDQETSILVEVTDTGKGISKKDLKYIWDKYYKADKTFSRCYNGSGIGLSIVKQVLESHNFKYGVNSKKNKGTTFYFEINKI